MNLRHKLFRRSVFDVLFKTYSHIFFHFRGSAGAVFSHYHSCLCIANYFTLDKILTLRNFSYPNIFPFLFNFLLQKHIPILSYIFLLLSVFLSLEIFFLKQFFMNSSLHKFFLFPLQ
jgi:hypothetical protein